MLHSSAFFVSRPHSKIVPLLDWSICQKSNQLLEFDALVDLLGMVTTLFPILEPSR